MPARCAKVKAMKVGYSRRALAALALLLGTAARAPAGPPFTTDDPAPVEFRHTELYLAAQAAHDAGGWQGAVPQLELNYGALPGLQLHLLAPLAWATAARAGTRCGIGDIELGVKYRFLTETDGRPQIGTFPMVTLPAGDQDRDLGAGETQVFLPLWLQKSSGPWTTYGGGGYRINPGADNRDWWLLGWLLQYQLLPDLAVGAEIFHETAQTVDGDADTRFNLGAIVDLSAHHHLLFSAGTVIQGPGGYQAYAAYQLTFGPGLSFGRATAPR